MNITTIGSGGNRFFRSKTSLYVENLNNSFSKLQIRSAKSLKSHDQSKYRSIVTIDPGFLDKAVGSERISGMLESELRGIGGATDAFANIKAAGHNVTVKGYTIDKQGRITAYGHDRDSDEPFEISLGRVGDKAKFKEVIYEHFDVTATQLLFNSDASFDLFA